MTPLAKVNYIVVHHSLTVDGVTLSTDDSRRFHTTPPPAGRGWSDIAYHATVEQVENGVEVIIGRPWTLQGAHAPGHNQDSIGVCIIGNFDAAAPDAAHWKGAVKFVAWLCQFFKVPAERVLGHREATPERTCPGAHFDMAVFRAAVAGALK